MYSEQDLKEKLQNTYTDTLSQQEIHSIVEESISSANMMIKEMYLPKFIETFIIEKRLDLFKHIIFFSKDKTLQIKFLKTVFEKSLIEGLTTFTYPVLDITDELCMMRFKFKLDFMISVIWKCLSEQDLSKEMDVRTVRFIDSCIDDMSVHQINELFYGFAKRIVEKIDVKDLRFSIVFKEWATHLVVVSHLFTNPWELLEKILADIDGKHVNAQKALQDYVEMIILNNCEMHHFLKLSDSFFGYCDVKTHLMVLSYIVKKSEWAHFQSYFLKLDESKKLNCRIFKIVINGLCYAGNTDQMKFVLTILLKNEDLFMNLELSQNQYKFIVMCLFQIIAESPKEYTTDDDEIKTTKSVLDKVLLSFKENLTSRSMKNMREDAISWMMIDEF